MKQQTSTQQAMKPLAQLQISERLKKLEAELKNAADLPEDPDAIHDLRVAIRRLNQGLRVFHGWFQTRSVKKLRGRLKKLMEKCGAVRNCDIAVEVLKTAGWKDAAVFQALEKERARTDKKLNRTLHQWQHRHRAQRWREHLQVAGSNENLSDSAADIARGILPAMTDDLFRAGREAAKAGSTHHQMHQFRLMAKRVRYTLEAFDPVYGMTTTEIMEALKGLQEHLGTINDCAATLEMVRYDREASAAVRRLAGKRESAFRTYWKKHFGPRVRGRWKATLGEPQAESPRERKASSGKGSDGNLHSAPR
jgi:CHAD domain-containing protein